MKLAVLGVVTIGVGTALSVPGLIGIGAYWVLMGVVARSYKQRLEESSAGVATGETDHAADPSVRTKRVLATDGRTFFLGTLIWLGIGIPSVAVGAFQIGIGSDDAAWRWLPIAVGAFALVIGVLGGLMYGAGSAITAAEGVPDKEATVWIRSVRETGTFVNERPRLEFELHVEPDASTGLASYDVTKKATVPFTALGSLRVGDGFRARVVGPEKPTSMEIAWDSPVSARAPASGADGATTTATTATTDVSTRLEELDELRKQAKITDEEYQAQRQRILGSL
jgi:hypothetical protein